jgi:2-oxo-4-hydroxy-4-carboxy-5-ureidoimidazoline decarboxylase
LKLEAFNQLNRSESETLISQCCSATQWIRRVADGRPYQSMAILIATADKIWVSMQEDELLEAFDGHPKIGDPDSLKEKYRSTLTVASHEQSGVKEANDQLLENLAQQNHNYFDKFGFIFIICASGKSANEMLASIDERLSHSRDRELVIAAREQWQITLIRLNNLFDQS